MSEKCESNEKLDYLIRLALAEQADEIVKMLDETDTTGVVCPPRAKRRINRIVASKNQPKMMTRSRRVVFRIMIAAVIALSLMLVLLLSVAGVREAIRKAIVEWFDDYVAVSFQPSDGDGETPAEQLNPPATQDTASPTEGETTPPTEDVTQPAEPSQPSDAPAVVPPSEILEYKKPTNLPSGYEGEEVIKNMANYTMDFYYEDEWSFTYIQMVLTDNEKWFDDTGMSEIKRIMINGIEAVILISEIEDMSMIVWQDGRYSYNISGCLTEQELISFAESVTEL